MNPLIFKRSSCDADKVKSIKQIVAFEGADISAILNKINVKDVIGLSNAWENMRSEFFQKSWSKLIIQVDDGWDEDDYFSLTQ